VLAVITVDDQLPWVHIRRRRMVELRRRLRDDNRRKKMTSLARRSNPVADLISWFDNEAPFGFRTEGAPLVRIEDYLENDTYVLRAEVPGLDPEKDLEVSVAGDVVTIRGQRHEEEQDKRHHEIHYGEFVRSVRLPQGSQGDDLKATYKDGVLEVRVSVGTEGQAARTIPIDHQV
jgi:HSP20 family molecular chaperone IbpA